MEKVAEVGSTLKRRNFLRSCLLPIKRVQLLLGIPLAMGEIETIFKRLHFNPVSVQEDSISVAVPTYRHDIHGENRSH